MGMLQGIKFLFDKNCGAGYNGAKLMDEGQMKFLLVFICGTLLMLGGCYYTLHSPTGTKISSAQIQEIKLGRSTETDIFKLLGPPSKKENKADGTTVLLYVHAHTESPTLPGGYIIYGFLDKDREEIFEIIIKNGVVQSFQYLKP
jgi:hypothetical protein